MRHDSPTNVDATDLRIAVAVSRYHAEVTDALRAGAADRHAAQGGTDLEVIETPGAFELVAVCRALAHRGDLDGVVALGCVITGETDHDRYINEAVSHGLTQITVDTGTPIAFGVLTCGTLEQARARAGGEHGNKGDEAMTAVLETVATIRAIASRGAR